MKSMTLKVLAHGTFATLLLGGAAAPAQADSAPTYLQLTKGGSISASDRVASDELEDVKTSAQIENIDEVLTANFGLDLTLTGQAKLVGSEGKRYVKTRLTNLSVKLSVPMNGAEEGSLVDFKSFGNNGKLTIGFNTYHSTYDAPFENRVKYGEMAGFCILDAGEKWKKDKGLLSDPNIAVMHQDFINRVKNDGSIDGSMESASNSLGENTFGPYALAICRVGGSAGVGDDKDYVRFGEKALGKEAFVAWRRSLSKPRPSFFFGAEASIGYNRFSVADRTTVTVGVKDRVGFDINGRAGWVFGDAGMVLIASGGWTRSYKAKNEVEVCGPPDLNGNTTCIKGQDGLPDKSETGYATVSLRKVLLRNKNGQPIIGIRPSVTFVVEDKDWQFELPVYLQRSDTGGLDAGVRGIYNTGSKKFGLGAFVGAPF